MDENSVASNDQSGSLINFQETVSEQLPTAEQCIAHETADLTKRPILSSQDIVNMASDRKHSAVSDAEIKAPKDQNMEEGDTDGKRQTKANEGLFSPVSDEHVCANTNSSSEVHSASSAALMDKQSSFQDTSMTSTPNSSSSGQDSGVSPDDSGSDIAKLPNYEDLAKQMHGEILKPGSIEKDVPWRAAHQSETSASPDTATSASDTQVTVSDIESPIGNTSGEGCSALTKSDQESVYYIKWITFGQANVPIITQNENGPCPLLAIMNVLLLKGKVKLAPMLEMVTSEQLMTYLGDCIFENMPQNLSQPSQANYEQNMQDAMSVMHKLQTGLDVNVKFTGVSDFEYTPELIIFDLLEISLYHGWLVDPQDPETVRAVNQDSYNQLVEKIICLKHSEKEDDVTQALIAEQFLDRTASQLTYHGLCELAARVKDDEPCVFFRNNHFSTLYKHNSEMFLLVTDQGFLTESNVVWETLSTVDGDCHFTDATFRTYTKPAASAEAIPDTAVPVGSPEQIDHDYQVALYLQEEASAELNQAWGSSGYPQDMATLTQSDHNLAMRMQEEEDRRERAEQQRLAQTGSSPQAAPPRGPPQDAQRRRGVEKREKEEKQCGIL